MRASRCSLPAPLTCMAASDGGGCGQVASSQTCVGDLWFLAASSVTCAKGREGRDLGTVLRHVRVLGVRGCRQRVSLCSPRKRAAGSRLKCDKHRRGSSWKASTPCGSSIGVEVGRGEIHLRDARRQTERERDRVERGNDTGGIRFYTHTLPSFHSPADPVFPRRT